MEWILALLDVAKSIFDAVMHAQQGNDAESEKAAMEAQSKLMAALAKKVLKP